MTAGYQCIAFDNRDVGRTAESPMPAYSIREMAEDTVGLMDALGLDSAHVVGDSMGGMIAQELAIAHPGRLRTLSLVCTEPHVDPYLKLVCESWRSMRSRLDRKDFARALSVWVMSHRYLADERNVRAFVDLMFFNPHPQSDACFLLQLDACLGHDTLGRLGRIQAPTLVLVGDEDILTPPRMSRLIVERIPGAKLVVVPEGPHGFIWEQPAEVNRAIVEFIGEHQRETVGASTGHPSLKEGGVR